MKPEEVKEEIKAQPEEIKTEEAKHEETESETKMEITEVKEEIKTETEIEDEKTEENKAEANKDETENKEETETVEIKTEIKEEKAEEEKPEEMIVEEPQKPEPIHSLRVGWSALSASLQLGEAPLSYGFDSDSCKVLNSTFTDVESKLSVGDVIGCFLVSKHHVMLMPITIIIFNYYLGYDIRSSSNKIHNKR